MTMTEDINNSG